jgi:hypothetical protein
VGTHLNLHVMDVQVSAVHLLRAPCTYVGRYVIHTHHRAPLPVRFAMYVRHCVQCVPYRKGRISPAYQGTASLTSVYDTVIQ